MQIRGGVSGCQQRPVGQPGQPSQPAYAFDVVFFNISTLAVINYD
jgi:hypothetical protein